MNFKEYKQLGDELSKQERWQEAATAYQEALKLGQKNANVYHLLAQVQEKQGDLEGAIGNYRQACILKPEILRFHKSLADILRKVENFADAISAYQDAIKLEPNNVNIRNILIKTQEKYTRQIQIKQTNYLKTILLNAPRPLFSPEHKLALFWSAKSGCTFSVKWFFYQIGLLEEALSYNPWIHEFRVQVFSASKSYKEKIQEILDSEINIIKVVRNPFTRLVSSYIHAANYGYENEKISNFLHRNITDEKAFSFREFVEYLETINLRLCDRHHALQIHPSEEEGLIKPNFIVKLENSFSEIREIEEKLKLKKAPLEEFRKSEHHTNRDSQKNESLKGLCADFPFERFKETGLPANCNFYDDILQEKVANLYKVDFETYNYDINLIPEN